MWSWLRRISRFRGAPVEAIAPETCTRWCGTIEPFLSAVSLAASQLNGWLGKNPLMRVTVEQGRRATTYTSIDVVDQFRNVVPRGLSRLRVELFDDVADDHVDLTLQRTPPAASVSVRARDRAKGQLLSARLHTMLALQGERPRWFRRRHLLLALPAAALVTWVLRVVGPGLKPGTWIAIGGLVLLAVVALYALLPDLEIIPSGDKRRLKRWGRTLGAAAGSAAALIAVYQFLVQTDG